MGNVGNCLYLYTCMYNDLEYCFGIRNGLVTYYRAAGILVGSSRDYKCEYEVTGIQVEMAVYCPKVILNVKIRKYYQFYNNKWLVLRKPFRSSINFKNKILRDIIYYNQGNRLILFGINGNTIRYEIGKVIWELDNVPQL